MKVCAMNTKHTIHITLERGGMGQTVTLSKGWQMTVTVDEKGGNPVLHIDKQPETIVLSCRKMLAEKDKTIKEQQAMIEKLTRDNEDKHTILSEFVPPFTNIIEKLDCGSNLRAALERQGYLKQSSSSRTELEIRCFAPECRVSRIKEALKGYISGKGPKWNEGYWVIVHKIFCDLLWWTGKDTDFVEWVEKSGYGLTENNFKKVKGKTKGWLERWYAVSGSDPYVVTAHELYDLFAGGPTLPEATRYENAFVAHGNLKDRIRKAQMGILGLKYTDIRSGLRGYYRVDMGQRINPMILADSLTIPLQRHKIIGTSGLIDVTKPGRRRRRQTTKALREREERKQLIVPRLQGQLLAPTHCI